jgi:hypothetical protein
MRACDEREFDGLISATASLRVFRDGTWIQPLPNGSWAAYDGVHRHWCTDKAEAEHAARSRLKTKETRP